MAINLAAYRDLLLPGLVKIEGQYPQIPLKFKRVFKTVKSNKANERAVEVRVMPLAQVKGEGQAITFDNNAGQRNLYQAEHFTVGLGYSITKEAITDNQYKEQFNGANLNMTNSFQQTKETFGAGILNNATTYNQAIVGDGQALCSTAHPVDGSTVANRPTIDMDLGEASLLSAGIQIAGFKDAAGLKVLARPELLIVPRALFPVAHRLTQADLRPGTSDNDPNALRNTDEGGIVKYMVWDYLTSNFAWFVKTNLDGLVHYQRWAFETDMDTDQTTKSLLVTATERYSFAYTNWRSLWGSFPTS